jgi:hypothetical protein
MQTHPCYGFEIYFHAIGEINFNRSSLKNFAEILTNFVSDIYLCHRWAETETAHVPRQTEHPRFLATTYPKINAII